MSNNALSTEGKIFQAAYNIFLLYGYHGTTLQNIAFEAGVHKSIIHYYFRSKDRLYQKIVETILNSITISGLHPIVGQKEIEKQKWFLNTELYNNESLFKKSLKDLYPNEFEEKLKKTRAFLL